MLRKITYLLAGIVWLASAAAAFAQDTSDDVHVKLSLADNKKSFRIGDAIRLNLEFTADREGYDVDTVIDKSGSPSDTLFVSPDTGVSHWLDEYFSGGRFFRDYFTLQRLSATATRVELLVNSAARFDQPGRYSVWVRTRRVTQRKNLNDRSARAVTLTSNEVSFDVQPMTEADEAKEVQRISTALDASRDVRSEEALTQELSFLTGDTSTREKVRRFLDPDGRSGNYFQNISLGLYIARNRALVFQSLEAAMRDPGRPVTYALLGAVTKLKLLRQNAGLAPKPAANVAMFDPFGSPEYNEIQDTYVAELAAGLSKRTGKSQTTTAITILSRLAKTPESATLREVRRVLLQQFEELNPYEQEYLLRVYWDQLRDPSLAPSLKKMLGVTGMASKDIHEAALKRLLEVAPDEVRPYVISEIRDPASMVALEALGSLSDRTLPEVDSALLEQIRRLASSKSNIDRIYLKQKTFLAARYATEAIYHDLMEVYRNAGDGLPMEARAGFLAYFARYNEPEALSLIEQTLDALPPGQDFSFLPDLTRGYFSDGIDALLRKRLESDEPQTASTAAYLISLYGSAADEAIIEARLERWRKDWSDRRAEAETNLQGTVERELIMALTGGKLWKLPPERVRALQQSCVTQPCRQNFHLQ